MSQRTQVRVDAAAWQALAVVSVATFMSALDGSVVNVALPAIREDYAAAVPAMSWVVVSYLLSISALLLPVGRLGDLLGYERMMGLGFLGFGTASVACGAAPGLWWLVVFRGIQGIGAAMLMASGPALLSTRFPPEARGRALGLQATATYLGLTLGPTLGGLLTAHLGWRWVFWINLPISSVAAVVLARRWKAEPARSGRGARRSVDLPSALLFAATIVLAILALEHTTTDARLAVAAGVLAVPLGALFVHRQSTSPRPLLPLGLFRRAAFSAGMGAAYLLYLVLFVANFLVPFFLQGPLGMSPDHAGLLMTAQPLAMVALTGLAGALSDRIGTRLPSSAGMAAVVLALWWLSLLPAPASAWQVVAPLALLGVGTGVFTSPNNSAILGAAPRERQGVASALLAAARNIGMVTGISIAGAFLGAAARAGQEAPHQVVEQAFREGLRVAALCGLAGFLLALLRPPPGVR